MITFSEYYKTYRNDKFELKRYRTHIPVLNDNKNTEIPLLIDTFVLST